MGTPGSGRAAGAPGRRRRAGALALAGLVASAALAPRVRLVDPPPTAIVEDRHGRTLAEVGTGGSGTLGYWPVAPGARLVAATLAAEDRRFGYHPGVDPLAVLRAGLQNLRSGRRVSGASTLAMQLARLQDPGPRTWTRKLVEAATAIGLTLRFGSRAVLDRYLRLAPYGGRIRGAGYAARHYFDRPAEDLSWAQAALLAAVPQAPSAMDLRDPAGRARAGRRAAWILAELGRLGWAGRDELAEAAVELGRLAAVPAPVRPPEALHAVARFEAGLAGPGATLVRASLDLDLQRAMTRLVRHEVARHGSDGVQQGALLAVELPAGRVRAAVGSVGWGDPDRAGTIDYTRVRRSPGSALKPFVYALALDAGAIGPGTVLADAGRARGAVGNTDHRFLGPMLPRAALGNSRNVPAVELAERLGTRALLAGLGGLGIPVPEDPDRYGPGIAIGTLPVTLEELATAYLALAGDGTARPLRWVEGPGEPGTGPRVLAPGTAALVAHMLADPGARQPSFRRRGHLELDFPMAIKTGTSSNWVDSWAVAWTDRYLVAAWMGRPDHGPMRQVTGYRVAARLVQKAMARLHPERGDGLADHGWPAPPGLVAAGLCPLSGALAGAGCEARVEEYFAPGAVPVEPCPAHRQVAVDRRTGRVPEPGTPPGEVEVRTVVELPARFAAWAVDQGLPQPPMAPALADQPVAVRVVSPEPGARLLRDPEGPAELATLGLEAIVDPPQPRLDWYLDGVRLASVGAPYRLRWPVAPGEHRIEARLPGREAGTAVSIAVR